MHIYSIILETSVYLLAFAVVHSIMASNQFKNFIWKVWKSAFAWYRLLYSLISLVLLILLLILIPKSFQIVYEIEMPVRILFYLLQILAIGGLISTSVHFDLSGFIGLKQPVRYFKKGIIDSRDEKMSLNMQGMYGISRHPLYFFTIIFFVFQPVMYLSQLILTIWMIAYFYIGSVFEERKLIREFGDRYARYQRRVSRIFPLKWLIEKIKNCCIQFNNA